MHQTHRRALGRGKTRAVNRSYARMAVMTAAAEVFMVPLLALALLGESAPPRSLAQIAAALPREVGTFRAHEPDELYDTTGIYEYIDGAAEVYLAFGMRACLARRYHHPTGDILLDLFEMGDAGGAFGAFTYDREGEEIDIGQGALRREGWLTFWQGRFFVSLTAEGESPAHRDGLLALARATAAAIGERGPLPELLSRLPEAGRQQTGSLRYLRHPAILATHLPLGSGDPLKMGAGAEAALVRYQDGALLLLVRYPSAPRAAAGLEAAREMISAPAPAGREGFWGAAAAGPLFALVGEAASEDRVRSLLAAALAELKPAEERP